MKHSGKSREGGTLGSDGNPLANSSESERAQMRYREQYTLLPTQLLFKVEKHSEYERAELLKKWQLDKLLQKRHESSLQQES